MNETVNNKWASVVRKQFNNGTYSAYVVKNLGWLQRHAHEANTVLITGPQEQGEAVVVVGGRGGDAEGLEWTWTYTTRFASYEIAKEFFAVRPRYHHCCINIVGPKVPAQWKRYERNHKAFARCIADPMGHRPMPSPLSVALTQQEGRATL